MPPGGLASSLTRTVDVLSCTVVRFGPWRRAPPKRAPDAVPGICICRSAKEKGVVWIDQRRCEISVAVLVVETVAWHLLAGEYPSNRELVGVR